MLLQENQIHKFVDAFPRMEELLKCGFYIYSFDSGELTWSPGMFKILGMDPDSVPPSFEVFSQYVVKEDRERLIETVTEARRTRQMYKCEFSMVNADGEFRRVYAESTIRYSNSEPTEYHGILKDLTESYLVSRQLEQKVKQLDKSNENLQEFVYVASHDLQEPLRKISTFAGRLQRFSEKLEGDGKMYLERISKSAANMQQLLQDLLHFSRLSVQEQKFQATDLNKCLQEAISHHEINIEETKTTITSDHLPTIEAYPSQVTQLFTNIISNAIKFRKPGVFPYVKVSSRIVKENGQTESKTLTEIHIEDNAVGFEEEYAEKIFHLFQRLNGKSEYPGSGIGLSICKKIAENHHGHIYAKSKLGQGSVFTIVLPANQTC
jgi:signal transduction histidine kinase